MQTIFARSTAPGRAGVAVVRISGPASWEAVSRLTGRALPAVRRASVRKIWWNGDLLDQAMVLLFEEGQSFTGDRSAEIHLHGSEAVVRAVLAALRSMDGLRDAEAGEFTRRALVNDRMDLSEVEGLGALLEAETEAQRRQAIQLVSGRLEERAAGWRAGLLSAAAALEVTVDFADEEVPDSVGAETAELLRRLSGEMAAEARGADAAAQIARGFEVAIVGAPNAGKSTLLNRLAGREAAITSEVAGTTRDIVEVRMEIGGQLVTVLDTAGIRESTDAVERLGVERARRRAEEADLRVFLGPVPDGMSVRQGDVLASGKADIDPAPCGFLGVSGKSGEGVEELLGVIGGVLSERVSGAGLAITERQAAALNRAAQALEDAADVLDKRPEMSEIVSGLIREGIVAVGELVGRVGVEDVLGEIFARFCIGK